MFETVLVASRGPVARSVVRTCQGLGVRAVTVHSEGDAHALHAAEADDSLLIGPAPPEQSYLDVRRVVEAAQQAGAQAVHPGAGALAVDPAAARAVLDAGLVWVGAAPEVLEAAQAESVQSREAAQTLAADGPGRRVTVLVLAPADGPAVGLCDLAAGRRPRPVRRARLARAGARGRRAAGRRRGSRPRGRRPRSARRRRRRGAHGRAPARHGRALRPAGRAPRARAARGRRPRRAAAACRRRRAGRPAAVVAGLRRARAARVRPRASAPTAPGSPAGTSRRASGSTAATGRATSCRRGTTRCSPP